MQGITLLALHHLRSVRQGLALGHHIESEGDYLRLLRRLAPWRPPAFDFPGLPAYSPDRCCGDDDATSTARRLAESVRRQGLLVKGRFQHSHIAYVALEDIAHYAAAFAKAIIPNDQEERVLQTLKQEGPLHKQDLAQLSGIKSRALSAALMRLQRAFLVFEDQRETEWNNAWAGIDEHPDWLDPSLAQPLARQAVLARWAEGLGFVTAPMAAAWSGWPQKECALHLRELHANDQLSEGYIAETGEQGYLCYWQEFASAPCLALLDVADPLVIAQEWQFKPSLPNPILKYLCQNGQLVAVLEGRWGIAGHRVSGLRWLAGLAGPDLAALLTGVGDWQAFPALLAREQLLESAKRAIEGTQP
jgi:hypothetical protein